MLHEHGKKAKEPSTPGQGKLLFVLSLVQLMVILDVTVVNIALPSIGSDLSLDRAALSWVVTAYTLVFGSLLLVGGRLADLMGRRRMFLIGLTVFTLASLFCGLAQNGTMLIVSRLLQGAGAALLSPAALSIITTTFQGAARTRALGIWAAIGGAGSALGVLLGGLLTSGPGWQWIFFINVPISIMVALAIPRLLASVPSRGSSRIDIAGALSLGLTAALAIFGLISAGSMGWSAATTIAPLVGSVLAAIVFIHTERSTATPIVPLRLFAQKSVVAGNITMLAAAGLLISGFFLTSLYLQQIASFSPLQTGLLFLPVALAMVLATHIFMHMLRAFGWRRAATVGFIMAAFGYFWLAQALGGDNAWSGVLPGFALAASGITAMFVVATTSAMARVKHREAGLVSGLISTNHELGASLGIAFVSTIAAGNIHANIFTDVSGFAAAFTASAIVAGMAAVVLPMLLPIGKPTEGQTLAH